MGANYKVGDLDVTISGVSKDAVSSLDKVIEKLNSLATSLGIVGTGFSGAFKVNNAATRAVIGDLGDIARVTQNATDSQQELNTEIRNGQAEMRATTESIEEQTTALRYYNEALSSMGGNAIEWRNAYAALNFSGDTIDIKKASEELDRLGTEYLRNKQIVDETNEAFKRMAMTEQELLVYDIRQEEATRKKRIEYLKLALATNRAGDNMLRYKGELDSLIQEQSAFEDSIKRTTMAMEIAPRVFQFEEATKQVGELRKELTEMFYTTGAFDSGLLGQFQNLTQGIEATNEAIKRALMTEQEKVLYDYQQENASRKQRIAYLNLMLATGQAGEKTREYTQELKRLTKQQQIADKVAGKSATGGLSKLIKRIGRIALYRTIRRGLQMITQTFKESIQAYAQVDDNINKTMSQLTSSTKIIKLSLGTVIFPIIQAITPAIQSLSVGFANMANTTNASMARMQGLTTYTKINVKALQDYRKQLNKTSGALFDFDKFRALSSKKDDSSIFLEEAAVADLNKEVGVSVAKWTVVYDILHNIGSILGNVLSLVGQIGSAASPWILVFTSAVDFVLRIASGLISVLEKTKLIYPIVGGILGYLTLMGATKFMTWLKSGSLVNWIKSATTATASFGKNLLSVLSTTQAMAIGIGALVGSIAYFVQNLDKMGSTAKWLIPVLAVLAATLTGVAVARAAAAAGIAAPVQAGITAAALAGAITLAAGTAIAIGANKYAKGASDIDGGAVFIAGEAGKTEMVYSGENGKANVANVQQMYQAEYMAVLQALKDYGAARGEMPQLQPASDNGIYQAAERGAGKHGKKFASY